MYLEKLNGPADVKKMDIDSLNELASEMRDALLHRLSIHGGHLDLILVWLKQLLLCIMFSIHQ